MRCKNWEVGSTWYVQPTMPIFQENIVQQINWIYNKISFLSTCRSAIELCLSAIDKPKVALIPAFTCHSVIEPFLKQGIKVIAYPIKRDLSIDWVNLLNLADDYSPQVVLIHGYFGFNTTIEWFHPTQELIQRGVLIIEDLTQTMFSTYEHISSHYKVGSIRKWLPVPDGAFLSDMEVHGLTEDTALAKAKWDAFISKGEYIFNGIGDKAGFMQKFGEAERMLDSRDEPYSMSKLTYSIIGRTDFDKINLTRKGNYRYLVSRLQNYPDIKIIHPQINDDEIPFLLPVYVEKNRLEFQKFMARHNVYPTIIWTCPNELIGKIDPGSVYIYDNILCFHIDQRYNIDDMKKVSDIVDLYYNSAL